MVSLTGTSTALTELLSGIIMALILVYTARFGLTDFSDHLSFTATVVGMCATWGVIDGVLSYSTWYFDTKRQTRVLKNEDNMDREARLDEIMDSFSGTAMDVITDEDKRELCDKFLDMRVQSDEEFKADDRSMSLSCWGGLFFSVIGLVPILIPLLFYDDLIEALEVSSFLSAITLFVVGYLMGPRVGINRFALGAFLAAIALIISIISVFTGG